ncbi:MAG: cupin domain-containing protein [Aerococcus urinaeequi]|uniref:cupin domain-containing protein n=1 Tax=Aerococcus TaxID=1375 RepID=UPI0022E3F786|nr:MULTISPECIES: cupin domain-containing protein [Aerococcus]MEB7389945.1 cupin domain-containing protein [Aerococcus viridans]
MKDKSIWIDHYKMAGHEEGGFFYQVLKSDQTIQLEGQKPRALYTGIYFLLTSNNPSRFHRLTADEVWYYHYGSPLTVHMITAEGDYQQVTLGTDVEQGQVLQAVVPKNTIFGSSVEADDSYALVSCMVSPGFEYDDFELFKRSDLLKQYPDYADIIYRLTLAD